MDDIIIDFHTLYPLTDGRYLAPNSNTLKGAEDLANEA
jgi:hypothetical protein